MTTLSATRRIVVMNSTLSDFSFLAISSVTCGLQPPPRGAQPFRLFTRRAPVFPAAPKARARFFRNVPSNALRFAVSGQPSSAGVGQRHQLPRPGQPGFPAANPRPQQPADDGSPLTDTAKKPVHSQGLRAKGEALHLFFEAPSPFGVVAEHIE